MEINTAVALGGIVASYFFVFCILAYYANILMFKTKVNEIWMFMSFSKPLYAYTIKNDLRIKFGYIPLSSLVKTDSGGDVGPNDDELKKYDKRTMKNAFIFHGIMGTMLTVLIVAVSWISGYDPLVVFKDFGTHIWLLFSGKTDFSGFVNFIHSQYTAYGKHFFIFLSVGIYFIFISLVMMISSLYSFLSALMGLVIIVGYFVVGFKFLELPFTFYIDLILSLIVIGFIYFLLLRFFIK
ncbi:hypothetical protein SAMN05444360_105128 [Chryseobacterium carnipullorum]|uniref:hypothetical protein n=1 Tax=Chryseobacterium carnipullorum TaxID=1124835 RepID=UPI000910EECF|nr:hypothetical protein [Chryseobacterium carnipullorum]SHL87167.1 hypothetical protein SAMN05444360_105128 [Chryseobacterium carnipullorum]